MTDSAGWSIDDCRLRCRQLEATNAERARDLAVTAQDLAVATYKLEIARDRISVMQRELDAAHRRERLLAAELFASKRQGESSHTRTEATPLLPRPKRT